MKELSIHHLKITGNTLKLARCFWATMISGESGLWTGLLTQNASNVLVILTPSSRMFSLKLHYVSFALSNWQCLWPPWRGSSSHCPSRLVSFDSIWPASSCSVDSDEQKTSTWNSDECEAFLKLEWATSVACNCRSCSQVVDYISDSPSFASQRHPATFSACAMFATISASFHLIGVSEAHMHSLLVSNVISTTPYLLSATGPIR